MMKSHLLRLPQMAALVAFATLFLATPVRAQDRPPTVSMPKASPRTTDQPQIKYSEFTLPNGLRVVLHEDHSAPVVAVEVWYNVGSKNEAKGKSGLAHLFEHMMFEGSVNMGPSEFDRLIGEAGGPPPSGSTTHDWTRFYTTVSSNYLERVLWMEAERMANTSPRLDSVQFERAREAVRNEFGNRVLSSGLNMAGEGLPPVLFAGGTYAASVIGNMDELFRETLTDLREFHEKFYVPNNAVLVIAGDITPADARRKVTKQFGPIPRGKPIVQPTKLAPFSGERRLVFEHTSNTRMLMVAWRGARAAAPDRMATLALGSIIANRLKRPLVETRRIAAAINLPMSTNFDLQSAGILQTVVSLTPTGSATDAEQVVDSLVADVRANGVTEAEVRRWATSYRTETLMSMQGVQMKAMYLGDAALNQGNPGAIFATVERAAALRAADVQAAARKYMTADRVVVSVVPTGKLELRSRPELPYVNATVK